METQETITLRVPRFVIRLRRGGLRLWARLGCRLLPAPGNVLFTLLLVAGLLWAQSVGALPLGRPQAAPAAASTGTIAYQGRLADANGNPLTGTYNMIFRLYAVPTGGTPLWEEQWTGSNGVRVSDGLFNVMLGSLTPIQQSVIAGRDQLWLGITVGTDDEMQPRVQLGSVPFAVQALTVPDGSITTAKIADRAVTQAKLGVRMPRLLGHKTCNECPGVTETLSQWGPVKGINSSDLIEVTVTTQGGDIMVHMTARWEMNPASSYICGIAALQGASELRLVRLEGNPYSTASTDWACSGVYLFTGLPAGTYTFRAMAWVPGTVSITWGSYLQIAAYEF